MPEPLSLLTSSGSEHIDEIAAGVITVLAVHFPDRIAGCYFEGGCADQAITPLSDIDLTIVFYQPLTPAEQNHLTTLIKACKRISSRSLDINSIDQMTLLGADRLPFQADWKPVLRAVTLKCASVPIYGSDVRGSVPFVAHAVYQRTLMHFPYLVLAGQHKHPPQLPFPLPYLDPNDEFYGYTGRLLRQADGTLTPSTKRVVHASGFIATALVALHTPSYVADKRTAVIAYRQHINDEWAEHLEAVQTYCRLQWGYGVPTSAADRCILQQICQRELAFENHFLAIYKDYLRRELAAIHPVAREFARQRIARMA